MNENLTLEDKWAGAEGANADGVPVMVRYRQQLQSFIDAGLYRTKIDITWAYDTDEAAQMPAPGEAEVMDKFETALTAVLEGDRQAILATVLTGRGVKTWMWYSAGAEETSERINDVLETFETFPVHIYTTDDADWDSYFKFITDFGGAA